MTEPCVHPESVLGEGRQVTAVCYRCGHISYKSAEALSDNIVVQLYDVPAGTLVNQELIAKMREAIVQHFLIPEEVLSKMKENPFPTREEFHRLIERNCVNGGVNDEPPV